jgi:anaerobic selenocysteine-containing dehydrogenase
VPGGLLGRSFVADHDGLIEAGLVPGRDLAGRPFASDCRSEVVIDCGSNLLMSAAGPERCLEAFKDCFVVSVSLYSDETAEALADIVLPDACYLERLDLPCCASSFAMGDWAYQLGQPAVPSLFERRPFSEVLLAIGERLGLAGAMNDATNVLYGMQPPHALSSEERCSWEEMVDRVCRGWFGPEHGLAWFRQNGVLAWPKRVEEAYPKPFVEGRMPLNYSGLPDPRPSQARQPQIGFDLQAVSYQVPWHASFTCQNPWLDEVSLSEPYSYFICLNPRTAAARGIADGDPIWVESTAGRRVQGRARLSEGVHPEAVAIAGNGGHWARGMPVARGQSAFFNALLGFDPEHTEPASLTIDGDARVRVYKE